MMVQTYGRKIGVVLENSPMQVMGEEKSNFQALTSSNMNLPMPAALTELWITAKTTANYIIPCPA